MGSLQVIITTLLFTAVALPAGSGLGTWFLEKVCHADPALVSIRTVDEVRPARGGGGAVKCEQGSADGSVLPWGCGVDNSSSMGCLPAWQFACTWRVTTPPLVCWPC